jgi:Dehydrogenases with different specificities (related to short-chain alcohol dehydrogenases)
MQQEPDSLQGKIALVAGGTRGAGRAIALTLAEAGATVYVTGRSTLEHAATAGRPETIDETAALITAKGGKAIAIRVDHTDEEQVRTLFERVQREQNGQLDILVNDIWGGDELTSWDKKFWEHDLQKGLLMQERAVRTHMITSWYAAPLLVARHQGLIIEITDGLDYKYRGNLYYSLAKISTIHLAQGMAADLRAADVTVLALTPGFLRSEAMLDHFHVSEENWREGAQQDPYFIASETPFYIGRAVVALASDPGVARRTGQVFYAGDLARNYGFTDVDGTQPHFWDYLAAHPLKLEE